MTDALRDGLSTIASFIPKLVLFLLILVIGYFVAKAIGRALSAILERVGFDRAVERGGVRRLLQQSRYDASDVVGKIIFYALLLFVFQLAFGVFPANPISDLLQSVINFLPLLIVAIIIIVVAAAIAAAVREFLATTLAGLSYGSAVANGASGLILGIGVIAALNQINVATSVTTPILIFVLATIAGILIIGVGGGLVRPMASRWETYLSRAEQEAPKVRESAQNAPALREQARQARERHSEPDQSRGEDAPSQNHGAYRAEPDSRPRRESHGASSPDEGYGASYAGSTGASGPGQQFASPGYQDARYGQAPSGGRDSDGISYPAQPFDTRAAGGPGYPGGQYPERGYPDPSPPRPPYPDTRYAGYQGGQYQGTQYSDTEYSDTHYSDTHYSPNAEYRDARFTEARYADGQYGGERYSGDTASWSEAPDQEVDHTPDDATQQFRLDDDAATPSDRSGANGRRGGSTHDETYRRDQY